jgi:hypothetical protein
MNISEAFEDHDRPQGSVECTCHTLTEAERERLIEFLVGELPSCYVRDGWIGTRVQETGQPASTLLASKLPDRGSVMSGDFGEILTLHFLGSQQQVDVELVKKWRHKQDRTKAAPHSDVIVIYRESPTEASANDFIISAEAKQKATAGAFAPIAKALEGVEKDRTGRLARTIAWLHEKALDSGDATEIRLIDRFRDPVTNAFGKQFKAVAIIDRELLDGELTKVLDTVVHPSVQLVVLAVSDLKDAYETVFQRAIEEVTE